MHTTRQRLLMSKRAGTDGSLLNSLPLTLGALAFSVVPSSAVPANLGNDNLS